MMWFIGFILPIGDIVTGRTDLHIVNNFIFKSSGSRRVSFVLFFTLVSLNLYLSLQLIFEILVTHADWFEPYQVFFLLVTGNQASLHIGY